MVVALIRGLQAEMNRAGARGSRANWKVRGKRGMVGRAQGKRQPSHVKSSSLSFRVDQLARACLGTCTKCSLHILTHVFVYSGQCHSTTLDSIQFETIPANRMDNELQQIAMQCRRKCSKDS